jgi:hypothetical protein
VLSDALAQEQSHARSRFAVGLYLNRKTAEEVAGFVLCALRVAKHFEDMTLAALP